MSPFRLAAVMLGHLRMNVNQAIDSLLDVASAVFTKDSLEGSNPEVNSKKLKEAIEDMLQARGIPLSTRMNDPNRLETQCKV